MSTLTQTQEALPTGTWREDPVHSHVGFEIGYAGGTFRGSFAPFEAPLDVDDDGAATLVGEARADSVHVLDENLNAHLLAPDFFDAERAPLLRFESDGDSPRGQRRAIAGELTIKGVPVPVELDGHDRRAAPEPLGRASACRSTSRRRSTAARSGSTGRWSCRMGSRRSRTT